MFGLNGVRQLVCLLLILCSTALWADEAEIKAVLDKAEGNLLANRELADKLLEHAENLLNASAPSPQQARLLNLQSHSNILQMKLNEAYAKALLAEQLASKTNNKMQLAEAIRRQGIVNFLLDSDAEAIELLTRSLTLHQQLNSEYVLNNLQAIGNLYAKNDAWADSLIEIGVQLVEKAVIRQDAYFEGQGYSFIISGQLKKQQYEQASLTAQQALAALGDDNPLINYYLAEAELKLKHYQRALTYIDKHLKVVENTYTSLRHLSSELLKAEILLADGQTDDGLRLLLGALSMANDLKVSKYQKEALYKLAEHYQQTGQFAQAYESLKQYEALKEAEYNTTQSRQLAFNRARLELEQKNQRITELELSRQLAQQQNNYQLYFMVLSSAIIMMLVLMYWRTHIQKRVLRKYSLELKHASEAKSEFLARMSHEIRTPINAIIGLTKLSRSAKLSAQQQEVNLQQIEESSKTLLGVINDILDFSKIEAGKLSIELNDFELDKVIEQAIRLHSLKAHEKNIELIHYIARDVPLFLKGDALRIQQILNNLLSNAVKFTKHGAVSVSVNKKYSESGVLLEFAVKDSGIGLTKSQLERLFEAFTQADESITRKFGGTGLGLTISKQLVELMGGEIWAESHPGQGSTFYFTLQVDEASQCEHSKVISAAKLSSLKVLLVDDVELSRQAAANALFRLNVNPDIAESGSMAIEKIRLSVAENAPYQLIILDWKMPDIDGIEVAAIIKQEFSPKPQIIMLSAYDMDSLQELGKPIGVEGYLQKPVNSSSLLNVILQIASNEPKVGKTLLKNSSVAPNLKGLKILLVEDNELNRKVARGFLAETKADIAVAENGQIAVQMLAEHPNRYGLILMDIQMPVMDGLSATVKIRNELQLSTPIIAMTAQAMKGDVEKSLAAGMNAHVTKPLEPDYLYQVLQDVLYSQNTLPVSQLPEPACKTGDDGLGMIDTEAAMRQLRVDETTYQELVGDFINLETKLDELQQALSQNDIDTVRKIIHFYSPALSYIGAGALARRAWQIEESLKDMLSISDQNRADIQGFQQAIMTLTNSLKRSYCK